MTREVVWGEEEIKTSESAVERKQRELKQNEIQDSCFSLCDISH